MKNFKFYTLLLLFISLATFAQPHGRFKEKKEQVKVLKVAFITNELDLTSDEAAKFWPVYNTFEDKQQEIRKQKVKTYINKTDDNSLDKLSEKEAATLIVQMENTEEELHQLKKKFIVTLKTILPATKILKLKKAEDEFSRKLLKQYRDKKIGR